MHKVSGPGWTPPLSGVKKLKEDTETSLVIGFATFSTYPSFKGINLAKRVPT